LKETAVGLGQGEMSKMMKEVGAADTVAAMDALLAQFMTAVDSTVGTLRDVDEEIQAKSQEMEGKLDRKVVSGTSRREGGRLVAEVNYDDGSTRELRAVKENGALRLLPEADAEP